MNTKEFLRKLQSREIAVTVVGLGYVGLPLACLTAEKGFRVRGFALDPKKIEMINRKESPMDDPLIIEWLKRAHFEASTDPAVIRQGDVVIVCVPTPIDEKHDPDLGPVRSASETIRAHMKPGQLIVVESTINPGVCEEVVLPILERDGKKAGKDFYLAHCPERINPGDPKWNVRNIPRVIGGYDTESLERAKAFYEVIIENTIHPMQSLREAEAVKIVENTFRDVNIAYVNELAKSFDRFGIDIVNVINGAKTKPFSFLAHYPSCGIGGHCIPVDPYYLIERAKKNGFQHEFLELAREINNSMPRYTAERLLRGMNEAGRSVKGSIVGLLGIAYKADIDDDRESPYYEIKKEVELLGAKTESFDPHLLKKSSVASLDELIEKSDAVILVTNHKEFLKLDPQNLSAKGISVFIDGKNALEKGAFRAAGVLYLGIGR